MSISNVTQDKEAIDGMTAGIKVATKAIRKTYGARGCNAIIETDLYPRHFVSNDAQTIVQSIHVEDKKETVGLDFLKELMDKQDKDSKDGRKTTCIIAEEVLDGGRQATISGDELKEELDKLIPVIEAKIDEQKRDISPEDVWKVATVSSKSESTGKIIGEIYTKIGKDGLIDIEGSGTRETYYTITDGIKFQDATMLSPWMAHDESLEKQGKKPTNAVYLNPTILVTKRKISHLNDINPLLEMLEVQHKKDLIIFTDDMDSGVATVMVQAHKSRVLNILIIKAPTLWKNYVFEDFAKVTGSTIVEDASGVTFKNLQLDHLGTCQKITVDDQETIITGGADISEHISKLRSKGDNDSLIRLGWLCNKTAILRLGANSESELSRIRLGAEDAKNASRLALQGGVVCGGGIALLNVSKSLPDTMAGNILRTAIREPIKQIIKNSGLYVSNDPILHNRVKFSYCADVDNDDACDGDELFIIEDSHQMGWDAKKKAVVNMWDSGILDSAIVTKNAIKNAISLASTVLTGGIVINLPKLTEEQIKMRAYAEAKMKF